MFDSVPELSLKQQ